MGRSSMNVRGMEVVLAILSLLTSLQVVPTSAFLDQGTQTCTAFCHSSSAVRGRARHPASESFMSTAEYMTKRTARANRVIQPHGGIMPALPRDAFRGRRSIRESRPLECFPTSSTVETDQTSRSEAAIGSQNHCLDGRVLEVRAATPEEMTTMILRGQRLPNLLQPLSHLCAGVLYRADYLQSTVASDFQRRYGMFHHRSITFFCNSTSTLAM